MSSMELGVVCIELLSGSHSGVLSRIRAELFEQVLLLFQIVEISRVPSSDEEHRFRNSLSLAIIPPVTHHEWKDDLVGSLSCL